MNMKLRYIKYIGMSLAAGMVVGVVGTSLMCSSSGMKSTRKRAKRAMHAVEDLVYSVKHLIS